MTTTMISKFEAARIKFRDSFKKGIVPVDGRQPIPDEIAVAMVQELIELELHKDALIGVYDAFLILSTHLKEAGFTNIVLLENTHRDLTPSQQKYYDKVKTVCEKSGIKYYVPPMNNYNRCTMKFDAILANPPYQSNDGNGDLSGSGTGALWWKITETSVNLLKDNGILSFITPTNILSGGDTYTKLILGGKRKLDLKNVITNVNQFFPKVGTKICRWVAQNSVTDNNVSIVNSDSTINTDETLKIYNDPQVQEIIQTLINHDGEKFDISVKNTADPRAVSRILQKDGHTKHEADKVARDFSKTQTDDYIYPINSNGKLKYGKVKWITNGTWKMMIPHMGSPFKYEIMVSDEIVCDQSCDVQYFDNEEDAMSAKQILDNPVYRWIIEQTRVGGRMSTAILSRFPNAPIEEVLTADQLSYIQSQL
jgi:hypothetical protein